MCLSTKQVSKISLLIVTTYTTHTIYLYSVDIVTVKKKKTTSNSGFLCLHVNEDRKLSAT